MTEHLTRYVDNMEKQREMLKRLYPLFLEYKPDTYDMDKTIVEQAMETTRQGKLFPTGLWPSIKRIYKACSDEQLIAFHNEKCELAWNEDEDDMVEYQAAQKRMRQTRREMGAWETEHRLNVAKMEA